MQEPNQLDCWSRGHTAWTQDCYVRFGSKKEAMEESIRCPIRTVASSGAPRQQRRAGVLDGMTVPVRIQNIESEDVLRVSPVCVATPSPPVCVLRLSIATPSKSSALDPRFKSSFRNLLLELHVTTEATGETIDTARGRRPSYSTVCIAIVWRASHRRARSSSTQEITRGCVCVDRQRET